MFTERRAEAGFLKLDPGAKYRARGGRDIYVVHERYWLGRRRHDYRRFTTVYLETKSEHAEFTAGETTEMLHFRLPNLAGLEAQSRPVAAVAAE